MSVPKINALPLCDSNIGIGLVWDSRTGRRGREKKGGEERVSRMKEKVPRE